jgi:hypothetical protein
VLLEEISKITVRATLTIKTQSTEVVHLDLF